MKSLAFSFIVLATAISSTSHALLERVLSCETADGKYSVSISENQTIGLQRKTALSAAIFNSKGELLASYDVQTNENEIKSTSFGQTLFADTATNGQKFLLGLGSTDFPHTTLKAILNTGKKISEVDPKCHP